MVLFFPSHQTPKSNTFIKIGRYKSDKMVDRGRWVERRRKMTMNIVLFVFLWMFSYASLFLSLCYSFSNFACDLSFVDERVRSHAPVDSMTPLPMNWQPDTSSVICGRGRDAYNHSTLTGSMNRLVPSWCTSNAQVDFCLFPLFLWCPSSSAYFQLETGDLEF